MRGAGWLSHWLLWVSGQKGLKPWLGFKLNPRGAMVTNDSPFILGCKQAVACNMGQSPEEISSMPKSMDQNPYDDNFLTPMAERRRGDEPGPDLMSVPLVHPPDPMGYLKTNDAGKGYSGHKHGKHHNNANTAKRK